jgi:uncharacterized protein (TIGR03435 family)
VIYNDWTKTDTQDIPCVTFIDLLQAMLREKFKLKHDKEKKDSETRIYKLKALIDSPKLTEKEKNFLSSHLKKEEEQLETNLLSESFEGFNLGLDYNSRKIDLLMELRAMANKALGNIRRINALQNHPKRQEKLDSDYNYYCNWHASHYRMPVVQ